MPGFYAAGGRPELTVLLPPLQYALHIFLGGFLDSARPSVEDLWRAQAEQRAIAASAIQARLPWQTPPEIVELAALDKDGSAVAWETLRQASEAAISARQELSSQL